MTMTPLADVFRHRRLVLGDVSHFDMPASALGEACPIGLDPVPVHEPIHEIEQAANREAECKAFSSHPAAKTASASACVMRVGVSVSFFTKARSGRSLLSMGAVARSWIRPSIVCGAIPNNSAAARWPP